jgi:hypothetical protein
VFGFVEVTELLLEDGVFMGGLLLGFWLDDVGGFGLEKTKGTPGAR